MPTDRPVRVAIIRPRPRGRVVPDSAHLLPEGIRRFAESALKGGERVAIPRS